ncbi:MAG: DUF3800 domain-containing protein [Pseudobdellovibrionaceae bacterium]|nr:DUF3800 domain-containing protein [Pseudobdellovibrionaceae bacterium]
MTDNDIVIFMDESGNTGSNILDSDQPFFSIAAWAFRSSSVPLIGQMIESASRQVRKKNHNGKEVKFSTFSKPQNFPVFEDLIRKIRTLSLGSCYSVIEKDFFGGMMMVEYLLDSWYNKNTENIAFQTPSLKQDMANIFCKYIPSQFHQSFINALKMGEPAPLLSAKDDITRFIVDNNLNNEVLSWVVKLNDDDFLECCISESPHFSEHCSPNFHAFSMQIQCLTMLFLKKDWSHGSLFFDEQLEYKTSFEWLTRMYDNEKKQYIEHPYDPSRGFATGPFFQGSVVFESSNSSVGIQSADLASSACCWILKQIKRRGEINLHARTFAKHLINDITTGVAHQTSYYASK